MSGAGLGVVVVGLGFGREFVPIYQAHPQVGRVAICEQDPIKLAEVGDRFAIQDRFTHLEQALSDDRFHAIHLLTPVPLHVDQTLAVLSSGRHCACAVPMATTLEHLTQIVEAADRAQKNYMMMETAVYDRSFLYVRQLHATGQLGEITFLKGAYYQDLEGSFPKYWRGVPPMHYATHVVAPILALAGMRASSVNCLGSGTLRTDIQLPDQNTFPLQTAIFRLETGRLAAEVTRSWFQVARCFTESFSVYGDRMGFEWQQLEHEPPVLYQLDPVEEGRRGRNVSATRVKPPSRPDLFPPELLPFVDGWHGGSHPHLAHEWINSIVERRPAWINARTAANWTAPGICAHESSLREGERVPIPAF